MNLIEQVNFLLLIFGLGGKKGNEDFSPEQRDYYGFNENLSLTGVKNSIYRKRFFYLKEFFEKYNWHERYSFFAVLERDIYFMNMFVSLLMNNCNVKFQKMNSDKVYEIEDYPKMFNTYHTASPKFDSESIQFIHQNVNPAKCK